MTSPAPPPSPVVAMGDRAPEPQVSSQQVEAGHTSVTLVTISPPLPPPSQEELCDAGSLLPEVAEEDPEGLQVSWVLLRRLLLDSWDLG